jgi:uncharacterized protein (TIGR03437 family)
MRSISVFLLAAAAAFAQINFTTGQAARAVIGQPTFTAQSPNSSDTVLGGAGGVAYANDTLFVADSNRVQASPVNHRVLLFKNLSGQLPTPDAQLTYNRKCPVCVGTATLVLGQPDLTTTTENMPATQNGLRAPTAVASDGIHVVVADTDHNRVLIWNSIPVINDQPADVVVGQPNFQSSSIPGDTPNAHSLRAPQGVWILNGKLYIADTGYNRVLIYNHIPTKNGADADVALGEPNLTTFVQPDLTQQTTSASASNMLNPVSVTSDGVHLFVTDLGYNRVLIWNSIPTTSGAPADVVIGQPDMNGSVANNAYSGTPATSAAPATTNVETPVLCPDSNGTDYNGKPTYPPTCNATLSFPRFALSDGKRLFIADGGNDRVMVFQRIPTQNAASADFIIGQLGGEINQASDAADSLRTPMSLAWDGTNLFVADAFNRRVTVYSIGANNIPYSGVRNAASMKIFSLGSVAITGSVTANDSVAVTIGNTTTNTGTNCGSASTSSTSSTSTTTTSTTTNTTGPANAPVGCGTSYLYTVKSSDGLLDVVNGLVAAIDAGSGDSNAFAFVDFATTTVVLAAKTEGLDGNNVSYVTSTSTKATEVLTTAGSTLTGGGDASRLGPGTLVSVLGSGLSAPPGSGVSADFTQPNLPTSLAGTQVYINGIAAPLLYVSPTQINAQLPWELIDTTSVNAYVRSVMSDGSVMVTTPIAVTMVTQNPGIFTQPGYTQDPKPGEVFHGSSSANGAVLVDGTINAGDVATITIEDRSYSYTVQSTDSLQSVRDALVAAVNQDPQVYAVAGVAFAVNFQIFARIPGPDGNGIPFSTATTNSKGSASLVLTATNTALCCANFAGSLVTRDNPAVPGEILLVYATGLGLPVVNANVQPLIVTGQKYPVGGPVTQPVNFVSSLAGGKTANVLSAGLLPGTAGVFQVVLQLNSSMPTDPLTQLYIAQDVYISNIVTIPVVTQ